MLDLLVSSWTSSNHFPILKPTEIYDTINLIADVSILDDNVISFYVSQKLKMLVKLETNNVS